MTTPTIRRHLRLVNTSVSMSRDDQLRELMTAHGPALKRASLRWTNADQHRAEDVVQETWVRAWKHLDELTEQRGSVRGWLLRVAHNIAVDHHRGRAARPSEVNLDDGFDRPVGAGLEPVEELLSELAVRDLLAGLPEPIRLALEQVYRHDRTAAQAGAALGIPAGTVKSRVHYGLAMLRSRTDIAAVPVAA